MNPYQFSGGLMLTAVFLACLFWVFGEPGHSHPTADQLYGCTIKQQAPNGDCP